MAIEVVRQLRAEWDDIMWIWMHCTEKMLECSSLTCLINHFMIRFVYIHPACICSGAAELKNVNQDESRYLPNLPTKWRRSCGECVNKIAPYLISVNMSSQRLTMGRLLVCLLVHSNSFSFILLCRYAFVCCLLFISYTVSAEWSVRRLSGLVQPRPVVILNVERPSHIHLSFHSMRQWKAKTGNCTTETNTTTKVFVVCSFIFHLFGITEARHIASPRARLSC